MSNTDPSGDELVRFVPSSATLTIRYNSKTLINQEAKVYLGYDNNLPNTFNQLLQLWTGVVDAHEVTDKTLSLQLRQNNFKKDVVIPQNINI